MKRVMMGLAAGAVWLMAAMPALAQDPQQPGKTIDDLTEAQIDELYCVYDYLGFFSDAAAMVDGYIAGDPDEAVYKEHLADVDDTATECSNEYDWSEDEKNTIAMIGFYGLMGDELEARLVESGLTEANIQTFYDVVDGLSDDDIGKFVDGVWIEDKAVLGRLRDGLVAKGLGSEAVLKNGFYLAEAYIIVSLLSATWMADLPAS